MPETTVNDEATESLEAPESLGADISHLFPSDEGPSYHTILEVWSKYLEPAESQRDERITPQWAIRVCQRHPGMEFSLMPEFQERFYGKLMEIEELLKEEIDSDPECLRHTTPEEDRELNALHYKNLLLVWQLRFVDWEKAWDCTDEHAAPELAAISEVHRMVFADDGIIAFLDNIKFEYTDDDRDALAMAIQERLEEGR